jgi:hypothetical protein
VMFCDLVGSLQVLGSQARQYACVDLVRAKRLLVVLQAETLELCSYVHALLSRGYASVSLPYPGARTERPAEVGRRGSSSAIRWRNYGAVARAGANWVCDRGIALLQYCAEMTRSSLRIKRVSEGADIGRHCRKRTGGAEQQAPASGEGEFARSACSTSVDLPIATGSRPARHFGFAPISGHRCHARSECRCSGMTP